MGANCENCSLFRMIFSDRVGPDRGRGERMRRGILWVNCKKNIRQGKKAVVVTSVFLFQQHAGSVRLVQFVRLSSVDVV